MSESDEHQRFSSFHPPAPVYVCSRVMASIFPLVYLVIGAVYLHDCPRQPYIPIYLIVMGITSLLVNVISLLPSCASFPYLSMALNGIIVLFSICWFITGNVWIYSTYPPSYSKTTFPTDSNYNKTSFINDTNCNKTSFINDTNCNKTSFINDTDCNKTSFIDPYCNKTSFINDTNCNKTSFIDPYCNKTLYLFAFWTNNLFYILIGVSIFLSCCLCILGG